MATHSQYRRKGLIQILLHILLRKGTNRGLQNAQIAFFSDNILAKKAYEKAGFQDEKTLQDPEFTKLFNSNSFTTLFQKL